MCAVQFHTGLGDNDITLTLASPAVMQPIIKAYPKAKIVLLHSSYPYTREAGYLTAVYPNVFLDFGEIFPFLSAEGQVSVIKQVLELCPTNKIMWSSESYFCLPPRNLHITYGCRSFLCQLMAIGGPSRTTLARSRHGRHYGR